MQIVIHSIYDQSLEIKRYLKKNNPRNSELRTWRIVGYIRGIRSLSRRYMVPAANVLYNNVVMTMVSIGFNMLQQSKLLTKITIQSIVGNLD